MYTVICKNSEPRGVVIHVWYERIAAPNKRPIIKTFKTVYQI